MGKRVLIVDASQQLGSAIAQFLGEAGYTAQAVTSFEEALSEVSRACPDLMITGVRLGQFNGLHLARRCHVDHPDLAILVMGVGTDAGLAQEAAEFDVRFVMRPDTYPELFLLVRGMLADGPTPDRGPETPDSGDSKPRYTS